MKWFIDIEKFLRTLQANKDVNVFPHFWLHEQPFMCNLVLEKWYKKQVLGLKRVLQFLICAIQNTIQK